MADSGRSAFRNDAVEKVTGHAKYADDYTFHGMIHGIPVYSDCPRGRLISLNTNKAENAKGVRKVLTWKDVPGALEHGQIEKDLQIFVKDEIRFDGDVLALVVADSREEALTASKLVEAEIEELVPVLDINKAQAGGSPLVNKKFPQNIVTRHRIRRGAAKEIFPECDLIVEKEFTTAWLEHAYMEPECAFANPRTDGVIELYGSFQHPFSTRRFVSAYLNRQLADFDVYSHPVGGSFGGKDDTISVIAARAALAASLLKVPVKILYDREWSFRESYKRSPYHMRYKYGLSRDGRIQALECNILAESGAVTSTVPWSTWRSAAQCAGPYRIENVHMDITGVMTNKVYSGAMRGFGTPQVNFAIEQMMDVCAAKLGLAPLEFRRINMVNQGCETITCQKLDGHTVSMEEVMDKTIAESGYLENIKKCTFGGQPDFQSDNGDELYGTGFALAYRGSSVGAEGLDFAAAIINCQFDGSVILDTGIHENGQGAPSVMMLALAEELDISLKRIKYTRSSTTSVPDSGTTVATRGTMLGISALKIAAERLKAVIGKTLAEDLGCPAGAVRFEDDCVRGGGNSFSWDEAMHHMFLHRTYPFAFGEYRAPDVSWDDEVGRGDAYFTYVYSCNVVELTVNRKTGKVKLLKITAGHDVGRAVNRPMVEGQIYGGLAQGVGMALSEELLIEEGRIKNPNFNKYKIPKASDMPEMKAVIIENADPSTPSGLKGIGEPATELLVPAIANAVYNATGIRPVSLPIRIDPEELKPKNKIGDKTGGKNE
ncbi:MAG: xanthine dehydrogenase family protein molybdopterin-binding subunit [Spirochaetales bacterium]|nr:xanthine dehydrogenase family protein molybdopterin-binding subunit [Spirochaetales bacterium]